MENEIIEHEAEENTENTETPRPSEGKKRKKKSKQAPKGRIAHTGFLKILQHAALCCIAVSFIIIITGSTVSVQSSGGARTYTLSTSDEGREYKDSVLFNTILGNEIKDAARLIAIREQVETDGTYDPDRIIDVSAYAHRDDLNYDASEHVTAKYYLGDLIKWSKYGFNYESVPADEVTISANALEDDYTTYSTDPMDISDEDAEILINRYTTVDGMNLEDCVSSWDEYEELLENLTSASNDLYTNYTDYLKLSEYFDELKSNIRYCAVMEDGRDDIIYTNVDLKSASAKKADEIFTAYGRYVKYDYDRMIYTTDTAISEAAFNSLMEDYEYSYPDNCTVYFAVDMDFPADDGISQGAQGFSNYLPYRTELWGLIIACAVLYLVLLILCTMREGRAADAEGRSYVRTLPFDDLPFEIWVILFAALIFAVIIGIEFCADPFELLNRFAGVPYFHAIAAAAVFLYDCMLMGLYYSLIRRIKGRHIWHYCLVYKLGRGAVKFYYLVYDNGSLIIRSFIPFAVAVLFNFLMGVWACHSSGFTACAIIIVMIAADAAGGVFLYRQVKGRSEIISGMKKITDGDFSYKADTSALHGDNAELAACVNSIGDSIRNAVDQSLKDEKMKADLIANVSHDIRTPLTSIINYVDLIKRENITDPKVLSYIDVLDEKSQRLKTLTDDLIEASKVSSGNVELELVKVSLPEMVSQSLAEFSEKFEERNLSCVCRTDKLTCPLMMADGKSLWRVLENLYGNICKYAMQNTRFFLDIFNVEANGQKLIVMQLMNMSASPLPDNLDELTERFIRGDESRTSEGSGLGLSIAKSLTELMGGNFELSSSGDMFRVELSFKAEEQ